MLGNNLPGRKEVKEEKREDKKPNSTTKTKFGSQLHKSWQRIPFLQITA